MTSTSVYVDETVSAEQLAAFASYFRELDAEGVAIRRIGLESTGDVTIAYEIRDGDESDQVDELYFIAGAYLPVQARGHLGELTATVYKDSEASTRWQVKRTWGTLYETGEWTDTTTLQHLRTTIEEVN